jgi:hypothetical protein
MKITFQLTVALMQRRFIASQVSAQGPFIFVDESKEYDWQA